MRAGDYEAKPGKNVGLSLFIGRNARNSRNTSKRARIYAGFRKLWCSGSCSLVSEQSEQTDIH